MANQKKQQKLTPNEEKLQYGISIIKSHPLFSGIDCNLQLCKKEVLGKQTAAMVTSYGTILLNQNYALAPPEWAYTIAHCILHLAFGHFDKDRMPGYSTQKNDGTQERHISCNEGLWNFACDIYISKFLYDIKFGTPTCDHPSKQFSFQLTDERKIYEELINRGYTADLNLYGTGTPGMRDMEGLNEPLTYDHGFHRCNRYTLQFTHALAHSVSAAVSQAGGHDIIDRSKQTPSKKAADWFINHYPLLGALASAFQITEDYAYCTKNEISIAAVDVTAAAIYVNPAAGLSEEELHFVLAHEFLHAGLQHHERCQGRDPYLWNVACDFVINGWLSEMQIGAMPEGCLYDESLKNYSAEDLYDRMIKDLRRFSKLSTFRGYGKGDIMAGNSAAFHQHSATSLDDFYKNALRNGLEYHIQSGRGLIPSGLIEEIRALCQPPIPWDVQLARWFDGFFAPLEKHRSYARPSRRQAGTPDIPRPSYISADLPEHARTFGVVIDTSGSMSARLIGYALGAIASFATAKEVPYARVVFCDAAAYDAGYIAPEDIAGRVAVQGRGGTILQPGIDLLEHAKDFPSDGPILIITDGYIEPDLRVKRKHAFLIPHGHRLPFRSKGEVFYFTDS